MIGAMVQAARLAADLSASRHKTIELSLQPEGIKITGIFRDQGVATFRCEQLIPWPMIMESAQALLGDIRFIDRQLIDHWRASGSPAEESA